jgi:hypothetical protein
MQKRVHISFPSQDLKEEERREQNCLKIKDFVKMVKAKLKKRVRAKVMEAKQSRFMPLISNVRIRRKFQIKSFSPNFQVRSLSPKRQAKMFEQSRCSVINNLKMNDKNYKMRIFKMGLFLYKDRLRSPQNEILRL